MPPNLPDARTAQRLLDVLDQLEQALRVGRRTGNAATTELETRLANLQFENQRLKSTRTQAAQRLGALLERLQEQAASESTNPVQEGLATLTQEHAA